MADENELLRMKELIGITTFGSTHARPTKRQKNVHRPENILPFQNLIRIPSGFTARYPTLATKYKIEEGEDAMEWLVNEKEYHSEWWTRVLRMDMSQPIEMEKSKWDEGQVVLDDLRTTKRRFNELTPAAFNYSRTETNPYEKLGRGPFLNRSAMKLVNMDALLHIVDRNCQTMTFVDLCGGPGGFSEYLLWRRGEHQQRAVEGFGLTLKASCDWKLPVPEMPHVKMNFHYGEDNTGNIYHDKNIKAFAETVLGQTNQVGVELVVGDGGFESARNKENQEELMHRLIMCQILTMAHVLKKGGTFICKAFELTDAFSIGLVYTLHCLFEKVAIIKPVTSRPASSERYLVCQGLKAPPPRALLAKLFELNHDFEVADPPPSILIHPKTFTFDTKFRDFLLSSNLRLAYSQLIACENLLDHATSNSHSPIKRINLHEYLTKWKLT